MRMKNFDVVSTDTIWDLLYLECARCNLYAEESADVSSEVRAWAIEHGDDPELRIVLCGYEGEHEMPTSWRVAEWHTSGGYASAERGVENRFRERLWFSPACTAAKQGGLFA